MLVIYLLIFFYFDPYEVNGKTLIPFPGLYCIYNPTKNHPMESPSICSTIKKSGFKEKYGVINISAEKTFYVMFPGYFDFQEKVLLSNVFFDFFSFFAMAYLLFSLVYRKSPPPSCP